MPEPRRVVLLDSIAHIGADCAGRVVVCGSHGGASAAGFVLDAPAPPRAVFFNDAGVGKDSAGIVALDLLEARGLIAAAYAHDTARIGDAADGLANGVVSHLNPRADASGIRAGMRVREAIERLGATR